MRSTRTFQISIKSCSPEFLKCSTINGNAVPYLCLDTLFEESRLGLALSLFDRQPQLQSILTCANTMIKAFIENDLSEELKVL